MCAQRRLGLAWASTQNLIRIFAVRMKKAWVLSHPMRTQWRLWSDWADAQADLSLRWAHRSFCWFCHDATHTNSLLRKSAFSVVRPGKTQTNMLSHRLEVSPGISDLGNCHGTLISLCQYAGWFAYWSQLCYSHMSHVVRKPVFAIWEQQRRRSACASAVWSAPLLFTTWIV